MLVIIVGVFAALWLPQRSGPFYLSVSIQYFFSIRNPTTFKLRLLRLLLVYNTIAAWCEATIYVDLWFLMFSKTCIYINR